MLNSRFLLLALWAILATQIQHVLCDQKIVIDTCLDMANKNPMNIRYGYPFFETVEQNSHCRGSNVAINHECSHAMNPKNGCTAFCKEASGWFYGEPIDVQKDRLCHPGDPCERTESYKNTLASSTTRITERKHGVDVKNETRHTQHEQVGSTFGWNFNLQYDFNMGEVLNGWSSSYSDAASKLAKKLTGKDGTSKKLLLGAGSPTTMLGGLQKAPTWPNNGGPDYTVQDASDLKKKTAMERFKDFLRPGKKGKGKKEKKGKKLKIDKREEEEEEEEEEETHGVVERRGVAFAPAALAAAGAAQALLGGLQFGVGMEKSRSKQVLWDRIKEYTETATDSKKYSLRNGTTYQVTIQRTEGLTRPDYAKYYCGSWYAVPYVGVDCGRLSSGSLVVNKTSREAHCAIMEESQSGHCFDYTFRSEKEGRDGESMYEMQFVLKDCNGGFVLPGEWQPPAFRHSFGVAQYVGHHVARYGAKPLRKYHWEEDDAWVQKRFDYGDNKFTKTIGPDDYTIEVCGRGQYCARHKLTPGRCYTFPRGHIGERTAHIVSARTSGDNCCVLFSKPECYGLPQKVEGNIPDLGVAGYEGLAHSVVCGVAEYCDITRIEAISSPIFKMSHRPNPNPKEIPADVKPEVKAPVAKPAKLKPEENSGDQLEALAYKGIPQSKLGDGEANKKEAKAKNKADQAKNS